VLPGVLDFSHRKCKVGPQPPYLTVDSVWWVASSVAVSSVRLVRLTFNRVVCLLISCNEVGSSVVIGSVRLAPTCEVRLLVLCSDTVSSVVNGNVRLTLD
jgi:hypothetical protein